MNSYRPQSGFSIVEVMVALVVLAVGMLGIAGLYVTTLRTSGSAISRMQAVNLASDMADRIRANRFAGQTYEDGPAVNNGCVGQEAANDCEPVAMAQNDLFVWQRQLRDLLPRDEQSMITYEPGAGENPDRYIITVRWTEQGSNDQLSYTLPIQVEP